MDVILWAGEPPPIGNHRQIVFDLGATLRCHCRNMAESVLPRQIQFTVIPRDVSSTARHREKCIAAAGGRISDLPGTNDVAAIDEMTTKWPPCLGGTRRTARLRTEKDGFHIHSEDMVPRFFCEISKGVLKGSSVIDGKPHRPKFVFHSLEQCVYFSGFCDIAGAGNRSTVGLHAGCGALGRGWINIIESRSRPFLA